MRAVQFALASLAAIGFAMPAYCQTPVAVEKLKIEVTRAELQIIGQGVMKLPYETAAPVLNSLQAQLNAIDAKAAEGAKPKADEKPSDGTVNLTPPGTTPK
jgi:hypothetical protein